MPYFGSFWFQFRSRKCLFLTHCSAFKLHFSSANFDAPRTQSPLPLPLPPSLSSCCETFSNLTFISPYFHYIFYRFVFSFMMILLSNLLACRFFTSPSIFTVAIFFSFLLTIDQRKCILLRKVQRSQNKRIVSQDKYFLS